MIACSMFIVSLAGWIFVRIRLRPKNDSDLDDYHYEFEEQHPEYARYLKWSRITFICAIIAALILLLTIRI